MSEQDTQVVEATSSDETVVLEDTTEVVTEDVEALKLELAKAKEAQAQILARAKKAEAELKTAKSTVSPQINNTPTDEAIQTHILKAQGLSDELLAELKAVAAVRKVSLIDAQNDPIFTAIKERKEAETKSVKASLGVSKGSRPEKKEKTFDSQGLTPEEHKAMWKSLAR